VVTGAQWETIVLALGSGLGSSLIVATAYYIYSERSNRRSFRREKLFNLKLEAFLDLLSAGDTLVSSFELLVSNDATDARIGLQALLERSGAPPELASQFAGRLSETIAEELRQVIHGAMGYSGPVPGRSNADPIGSSQTVEEALERSASELRGALSPYLPAWTDARRRLDRAFVKITLLGVPDELYKALRAFDRRLAHFGFEGGVKLAQSSQAGKEKEVQKLRDAWAGIADACRADLAELMS
jgi:hypothetical protein